MKLTIGMMVKNESKYLEECLKSLELVRAVIDSELVIVDTGSRDNTVEIARKYTDRVYFHRWNNNFSEMRNIVIDYARGEWFFSIDGDEVVENHAALIDFFESGEEKKYNTALLTIKNYTNLEENTFTLFISPRLFRNDEDFHFEGVVHNQPVYKEPVCKLDLVLQHYGYLQTDKENIERKFKRTSTLLRSELDKNPENIYYWFQLSKSYGMCKYYGKAYEAIQQAYEVANRKNIKLENRMYVYIQLAKTQVLTSRYQDAEKTCHKALQAKDGYADLYYYLAISQFVVNKSEESLENFLKYIDLVINFQKSPGYLDSSVDNETISLINEVYIYVLILCERLNKYTAALEYIDKIEGEKYIEKVLDKIMKIYLEMEEYDKLKNYYDTKIGNSNLEDEFIKLLEKYRLKRGDSKRYKLAKVFSKGSSGYASLNKIRIALADKKYQDQDLLELVKKLNLNKLPVYYADILYYMMLSKRSIDRIASDIKEDILKDQLEYLTDEYDNSGEIIYNYLLNEDQDSSLKSLRNRKVIENQLLLVNGLCDKQYKNIFKLYIEDGINYLTSLYSTIVIQSESINDLKNDEEIFLLYIYQAFKYKRKNKQLYKMYLNKALEIYPLMKKGVQILIDKIKTEDNYLMHNI